MEKQYKQVNIRLIMDQTAYNALQHLKSKTDAKDEGALVIKAIIAFDWLIKQIDPLIKKYKIKGSKNSEEMIKDAFKIYEWARDNEAKGMQIVAVDPNTEYKKGSKWEVYTWLKKRESAPIH